MGEIKSVKVDNWGVFFLQKLQNFFNKTDYCDLTLQFRDNSQLKVHRLVLSACTDYFNVLEQTCEVVDDALLMPDELQADVVVPIVNFMYTGTLEFELKMYGKLLRTAKEMNMTVLLKLLEAHRRTMENVNRAQRPPSPKPVRRRMPITVAGQQQTQAVPQQRRILTSSNVSTPQAARVVQTKSIATNVSQVQYRQQIGASSLLRTSAGSLSSPIKTEYASTAIYGREQFKIEPEDYDTSPVKQQQQHTSPFEQLRKGYNNNKRPATTSFVSPPAKKPNIEDVKEFAEQQRMRKQIAAEYGDDPEYEGMLDDDIHNDDDDDDTAVAASSSATTGVAVQATTSAVGVANRQVQQGTTTITFRQEAKDKPPTIVVKDSTNSNINHTKIISEVLRQYPHLVKNNKNIKLKIMPNACGQAQKIIVKKEPSDNVDSAVTPANQQPQQLVVPKIAAAANTMLKMPVSATVATATPQPVPTLKPLIQKSAPVTTAAKAGGVSSTTTTQKRRIDSKTMHALIALGAENTTGPWLCLRCGVNGRPISIPSYRGFRRHLINTHKETIDPALCEHCGKRSNTNRELHFHMQLEHKVKTTLYTFPECLMCAELFLDTNALNEHMVNSHPDENKQQCIYCNKIFAKELQLYTHMKTYHKKQALEDGIIDHSDEEFSDMQDEAEIEVMKKDTKVKILSDISLPNAGSLLNLEPSSEADALSTVASGIATSIGVASGDVEEEFIETAGSQNANPSVSIEPKFVNADGNEMLLTAEQRKEIMSQLNQESGGVVMVLNEPTFASEAAVEGSNDTTNDKADTIDASEHEADEEAEPSVSQMEEDVQPESESAEHNEEFDNSPIYNELPSKSEEKKKITSTGTGGGAGALDESKESIENLEWAENLISAHELADENAEETNKAVAATADAVTEKEDDISKKLRELTGDWSDDENDEEDDNEDDNEIITSDAETLIEKKNQETELEKLMASKSKDIEDEKGVATCDEEDNKKNEKADDGFAERQDDEDDIDIAMRSLHKEDMEMETDKLTDDDEEVKEEPGIELEQKEQRPRELERLEKHGDDDELELEENPIINETNKGEEAVKQAELGGELHEKEEENSAIDTATGKSLLEQLIAETEVDTDAEVESTSQDATEIKAKAENEGSVTAIEPMDTDAESADADRIKGNEVDVNTSTDQDDAVEIAIKEDKKTTIAASATKTVVTDTDTEMSASAATTTTTTTTPDKTDDKVKSLISEWADDDDDDDNDGDVDAGNGENEDEVENVNADDINNAVEEEL